MDFGVRTTSHTSDSRGWMRGKHGTDPGSNPSITLDLTKFDKATHFKDGYMPSGVAVGQVTATGLYGPYDPSATDGRETFQGLTFNGESVAAGQERSVNALYRHGGADQARMPFTSGPGAVDDAAKADLPLIDWK